jgi:hypothetical protein
MNKPNAHADWCRRFDAALAAVIAATKKKRPVPHRAPTSRSLSGR